MAEREMERRLAREWRELEAVLAAAAGPSPRRRAAGRPVLPLSPLALYARLEEALESMRQLRADGLEALADRYVTPAWTVKDVVGHLASWATEFRSQADTVLAGESFDYAIPFAMNVIGPNEYNARAAARQRERPLGELLAEFETQTRTLQDRVLSLDQARLHALAEFALAPSGDPGQRWRGSLAFLVLGKCSHDEHHLRRLREFVRAASSAPRRRPRS